MKSIGQIFTFCILKTFTEKLFLTFCLLILFLDAAGQVTENFNDNELEHDPRWSGMTEHFVVAGGRLQLKAPPASGAAFIATENAVLEGGGTWQFSVELAFNPSGSNFARAYLASTKADLNSSLDGYFVQIGSSSDDVSLYRQIGAERTKIIDGMDGALDSDQISLNVKVTRSSEGEWTLLCEYGNSGNPVEEGSALDNSLNSCQYSGIQCTYTSTRSDKFFFDDFVMTPFPDTDPPRVLETTVISGTQIRIVFSEKVLAESVEDLSHFSADQQLGHASSVDLASDGKTVDLSFVRNFEAGVRYTLSLTGIADVTGNEMAASKFTFTFLPTVVPGHKDVVLSEFLADPTPPIGLPEFEFVEILNRSSIPLDLSGWTISDGGSMGTFEGQIILGPGEYATITSSAASAQYGALSEKVISVRNFPSLNNTSDHIILKSKDGTTIDSLMYSDSWHGDRSKSGGGWSLEVIDPENFCGAERNWTSSEDDIGGTPGKINSADADNPDLHGPAITHAYLVSPDTIRILFNETLAHDPPSTEAFTLFPTTAIDKVALHPLRKQIDLILTTAAEDGATFTLTITGIYDCSGNEIDEPSKSIPVISPEAADSLDIILNEVLFNPRATGTDFIEIFNTSEKYVDLRGWSFANLEDGQLMNATPITDSELFLQPKGYLSFGEDAIILLSEYPRAPESNVIKSDLPPMNDDDGQIALIDPEGRVMDFFHYNENMHSVFLKSNEGVSLERLSPEAPGTDGANWKSSAAQNGFATPGEKNSNHIENGQSGDVVQILPEVFIPDSGPDDFARIEYNLTDPGFTGNIKIFDQRARLVKTIAENEILGTSGFFRWDGDKDNGNRASLGAYMVWIEIYDNRGVVKTYRKRVVVAGRL